MFRKTFTVLLVLVLVVSLQSQTQEVQRKGGYARLLGMGNNPYIVDPYSITVNPAWASLYSNFVWGDLGSTVTPFQNNGAGQFAAINFGLTENLVLGGILSRNDFNGVSIASLQPTTQLITQLGQIQGVTAPPAINNNLELLGAFRVGKLSVGFGVSYANTFLETNPPTGGSTESSASQIGFNAGILTHTSLLSLDAGVSLLLPSASYTPAQGAETKLSQTILVVNGRVFLKLSNRVQFVPGVVFSTASGTSDIGVGNTTTSNDLPSITLIGIGAGINYRVGDFLLAGGPAFATVSQTIPEVKAGQTTITPELSNSLTLFPIWNMGFEWDIASWLTGRLGYIAVSGKTSVETGGVNQITETITRIYGPSGATVGVGFNLDNFTLNATINDDVLRQGLNNIGGGGATFAYLSMSYAF